MINPTNGKVITQVSEGTPKDVDIAVEAAQKAFDTVWGLNTPGYERGKLLYKLPGHQGVVNCAEFAPNDQPTSKHKSGLCR